MLLGFVFIYFFFVFSFFTYVLFRQRFFFTFHFFTKKYVRRIYLIQGISTIYHLLVRYVFVGSVSRKGTKFVCFLLFFSVTFCNFFLHNILLYNFPPANSVSPCTNMNCPSFCFARNSTFGSCQCPDFHRMNVIDRSCLPLEDNFLYLATQNQIVKSFLDFEKEHDEIIPLKLPHGNISTVAVSDGAKGLEQIFWAEYKTKSINAVLSDGSGQRNVISNVMAKSLSLDHGTNVLYFINMDRNSFRILPTA